MNYVPKDIDGFSYWERLHGAVTDDTTIVVTMHWMTGTAISLDFLFADIDSPVRIIALQGQYPFEDGYSWYPDEEAFYEQSEAEQVPTILAEAQRIADFLQKLRQQYTGKVIVTGMSQGGDLSLVLATYHPTLIEMAIPCAGRLLALPESIAAENLPRVRLQQGATDAIVSAASAQQIEKRLQAHDYDVTLNLYEGVAHGFSDEMITQIQTLIASV